jgi:hypothetical protein
LSITPSSGNKITAGVSGRQIKDQRCRTAFSGEHSADYAHARAEPGTHELAGGAADEDERERRAHHRCRDAFCFQEKWQEGQ